MYRTKRALSVGIDYFANTEINSDVVLPVYIVRLSQTRMRIVAFYKTNFKVLHIHNSQERKAGEKKKKQTQKTKDTRDFYYRTEIQLFRSQ